MKDTFFLFVEIADKPGWELNIERAEDEYIADFGMYTDAGEDFRFSVYFDGTIKDLEDEIIRYALKFDPDEHAENWCKAKLEGVPGIPCIRKLIEDADEIDESLENLWKAYRNHRKFTFSENRIK